MTVTSAMNLELPELDLTGLDRGEAMEAAAKAREAHWLARAPLGYAVTGYADAVAILRDQRWHSAVGLISEFAALESAEVKAFFENRRQSILGMEGAEHARLRRLVAPAFTPGAVARLKPFMREVISERIDAVLDAGRCEFVAEVCEPYPIPIICELLGAPKEDWRTFSNWATHIFKIFNQDLANDLPDIAAAFAEMERYVTALIEERRAAPGDDLLSDMIAAEEAGDRLDNEELNMLTQAILLAGTDTTRNQLACCMALFATHPDQWQILRDDPSYAAKAVEETLRFLGTARATGRFASEDIVYRDVLFQKGSLVMVYLAAGNRDPLAFDDPNELNITAERSNLQLSFGSGIHHCMGAALARAELAEALILLAERMETVELDGPVEWKPSSFGIWGPSRLPLRFTAA